MRSIPIFFTPDERTAWLLAIRALLTFKVPA